MSVSQIATEALNFFGAACSDVAYTEPWKHDNKAAEWAEGARATGCRDLPGAYTDVLYNDTDMAMDMLGDRLCDECGDDDELHDAVVKALETKMPWMPASLFKELRRGS